MIHTTPIAAIKQNAPPSAAPIMMLGFVRTDSPPELELNIFALIVLGRVFSGAVSSRDHFYIVENVCLQKLKSFTLDLFECLLRIIFFCVDELFSMIPPYMTAKLTQK
jgi:hypothetical protein